MLEARTRASDRESERQPRVPSPTGRDPRAGRELNCSRAEVKATQAPAHTQPGKLRPLQRHQQQQRDKCAGHKRKRNVDATEASPGKIARARADGNKSDGQLRVLSPTGMDSRAGPELSCDRADAGAAPTSQQQQQQQQQLTRKQRRQQSKGNGRTNR